MIRHKYNAKRTVRDGLRFDSQKEARYYDLLKLQQSAGQVVMFLRQVPFDLPGGVRYRADFLVFSADGSCSVVDVKGCRTSEYKAKKKMVEALYPVVIEEV